MKIKVLTWNVMLGLGDPDRCTPILMKVLRAQPEIAVFSEAFSDTMAIDFPFKDYGYQFMAIPYKTSDDSPVHLGILYKMNLDISFTVKHVAHRQAMIMLVTIEGQQLQVIGTHLHDKLETYRLDMVTALLLAINEAIPTIMLGDLNALHGSDYAARVLRSKPIGWLAPRLPHPRARSLATRLVGMADGRTLEKLIEWGFIESDKWHWPTMKLLCFALVQLDHILHTKEIRVLSVRVLYSLLSDHNPVVAILELASMHDPVASTS